MAKTKSKKTVSDNFETLKAQMMQKRILAESKDNHTQEYTSRNEINNTNEDNCINNDKEDIKFINEEENTTKSAVNTNKIVIKKVEKPEQPKRITYYLKPETIKKIDKYSKMAGMGKSEFVQKLLDEVLNNLEIEK